MKKEDIIIVDKDDNIIGYEDRKKITIGKNLYRCSTLRVENDKGDILITKRADNKRIDPGKRSSAVAGTNDKGETYESNIIKETEEEIGVKLNKFEIVKKIMIEKKSAFCSVFKATMNYDISQFKIQKEEVADIKRISKNKLRNILKTKPELFTKSFETITKELKLL